MKSVQSIKLLLARDAASTPVGGSIKSNISLISGSKSIMHLSEKF